MTKDGYIQEIASQLSVLRPDPERMEAWIGAMKSGAFAFGYGLLRSGDDEYDPFGVLAAISADQWTWDETEQAWAIQGQALMLTTAQIAHWLNLVRPAEHWVERFRDRLTEAADGAAGFSALVDLLEQAQRRAAAGKHRLDPEMSYRDSLDYIGRSRRDYIREPIRPLYRDYAD